MSDRIDKVNSLIHQKLGEVFSQVLEIPTEYFVTITRVQTSSDLRNATIYLSVLPFTNSEKALAFIIRNRNQVQKELGKRVKIKYTPKLYFKLDDTEEKASKIEELIDAL